MNRAAFAMMLALLASLPGQAQSLDASSPEESVPKISMDYDKYMTGGIVSTLFGFGMGHAFQERYAKDGWIFTLAEMAAGGVVLASLVPCRKELMDRNGSNSMDRFDHCEKVPLVIGYMTFSGLRVWEIADAWLTPNPALKKRLFSTKERRIEPSFAIGIIPQPHGAPALDLVYRF